MRDAVSQGYRLAAVLLGLLLLMAVTGPWWIPHDPVRQLDVVSMRNAPPSAAHWLGTDAYARDVFSRAVVGARTSLEVAGIGTLLATGLALVIGTCAAWMPRSFGATLMAGVDLLRALPRKLLLLLLLLLVPLPGARTLGFMLGLSSWMPLAVLVYEHTRQVRRRPHVESAIALGASSRAIAVRHVWPHVRDTVWAASAVLLADMLALEAAVSFLGIGVRPPRPSWGSMVMDSLPYLATAWWVAAVPCALLAIAVVSTGVLADALAAPANTRIRAQASGRARVS